MGSKSEAKKLLKEKAPSIPIIPGYNGDNQSVDLLIEEAIKIGTCLRESDRSLYYRDSFTDSTQKASQYY